MAVVTSDGFEKTVLLYLSTCVQSFKIVCSRNLKHWPKRGHVVASKKKKKNTIRIISSEERKNT